MRLCCFYVHKSKPKLWIPFSRFTLTPSADLYLLFFFFTVLSNKDHDNCTPGINVTGNNSMEEGGGEEDEGGNWEEDGG